jgi:hypothetical protein
MQTMAMIRALMQGQGLQQQAGIGSMPGQEQQGSLGSGISELGQMRANEMAMMNGMGQPIPVQPMPQNITNGLMTPPPSQFGP